MNIVEVDDLKQFKKLPIGIGTSAVCYRIDENTVAKLFYDFFCYDFDINNPIVRNQFELFSSLSNDTYKGPNQLIVKDGIIVGYLYPFIDGKTLHRVRNSLTVDDIVMKYSKVIEDTKRISSFNFRLHDLHDKNILVNDSFRVIDLDRGYQENNSNEKGLLKYNMIDINRVIIHSLFHVDDKDSIVFYKDFLQELYDKCLYEDYRFLVDFLEQTEKETNLCKVKYKKIRKRINYRVDKTYY